MGYLVYVCGLDGCFSGGKDLTSGRLGGAFSQKFLLGSLFGCHFMGVLSSSQTMGTNIGIRYPRASESRQGL
jgi:hypothetical protein